MAVLHRLSRNKRSAHRARSRAVLLGSRAVAVLMLSGLFSRVTGQRPSGTRCAYTEWASPVRIAGIADTALVQFGSLVLGQERGYLVGNQVSDLTAPPRAPGPLVVVGLNGERIAPPPGRFVFGYPKGVVDARGRLHLLWAEPISLDSLIDQSWTGGWERRLWYAVHNDGSWTEPREVYRDDVPFFWSQSQAAGVRLDRMGRVHVVARRTILARSLVHLVIDGAEQRSSIVPTPPGVYTDFALDGDRIFVVLAGWVDQRMEEKGNVYFMRSDDLGYHWTAPVVIGPSVQGHAREVQVVLTPDASVRLLWAHDQAGRDYPDIIRHAESGDLGTTWTMVDELDVPSPFTRLRAAADRCGEIHVAFDPWPTGDFSRRQYGYAHWFGQWEPPLLPFPNLRPVYVDLAYGMGGDLYLFAPSSHIGQVPGAKPVPMLAIRRRL